MVKGILLFDSRRNRETTAVPMPIKIPAVPKIRTEGTNGRPMP